MTNVAKPIPGWLIDAVVGLVASAYQAGRDEVEQAAAASVEAAPPAPNVLPRAAAATYLNISLSKFDQLVRDDELPTFLIGSNRYARRAELDAWLDGRPRTGPASAPADRQGPGADVSRDPHANG